MKLQNLQNLLFLSSVLGLPLSFGACSDNHQRNGDGDGGASGDDGDGDGDGNGDGDGDEANDLQIALNFQAQVGDELFRCGDTYVDQGSTGVEITPQDFRFYVSDVHLINTDGEAVALKLTRRTQWQAAGVTLLDFEDGSAGCKNGNPAMNTTVIGTIPDGDYVGISFSPAVPIELNHEDPATLPAPLQAGGMTWGWLFGYKFIRAEVVATASPQDGQVAGAGIFHLGSTGCDNVMDGQGGDGGEGGAPGPNFGAPPTFTCTQQNRAIITLDNFSPESDLIVADIGAMMKTTDLGTNSSCHSGGPSCDGYFASVGLDFVTGEVSGTQSAFRLESK